MTQNQFELLTYIELNQGKKISQREMSNEINLSLGTVNKIFSEFIEKKYIDVDNFKNINVTAIGYKSLEPYKVKKVIYLAAGFGSRMVPITLNTPKGLVMVHGKKIIETTLDAVIAAGITNITIVRGYLSEQFDILLKKYPTIKFIENETFNQANNIASAYMCRELLENAYVIESDLILYNKHLIRKYEYSTNYLGKYVKSTEDWCFEVKNGIIKKMKIGGENCYHMYGISYWDRESAKQMEKDIAYVYNTLGGKEKYWDQVSLDICKNNYSIMVRECKEGDIIEIDTFNELKEVDPIYKI
ncbi:MAG: sugar phosphate nucleotidyltransferase [Bacilli bacterium]